MRVAITSKTGPGRPEVDSVLHSVYKTKKEGKGRYIVISLSTEK